MSSSPSSLSSTDALPASLGPLDDAVCRIDVVLGTGTMTVRDCLGLRKHMVMRLVQTAGVDLQVMANGVLVALGEVVIVDDSTAVRVTEIVPPVTQGQS